MFNFKNFTTLKSKLSIDQFLLLILFSEFIALFLGNTLVGSSILFNFETLTYAFLILVVQTAGSYFSSKDEPVSAILSFYISVFIFSRLVCYLFIPLEIYFPYPTSINVAQINKALLYVLLGNITIILGAKLGNFFYKNKTPKFTTPPFIKKLQNFNLEINLLPIIILAILFISLELVLTYSLGVNLQSVSNEKGPYHTYLMLLRTLVGFDTYFYFFLSLIFITKSKYRNIKYFILAFLYWVTLSIGGSKGGLMKVDLVLIIHLTAIYLKEKFNIKYYALALLINFIVAVPVFMVIQKVREQAIDTYSLDSILKVASETKPVKINYNQKSHADLFKKASETSNWDTIRSSELYNKEVVPRVGRVSTLLNRLGVFDYIVITLNIGDEKRMKEVFNIEYLFKSMVNIIMPGNPYEDSQYKTERMMPYVFDRKDIEYVGDNFNTEPLTIWGAAYVYSGYFGGLLLILLMSLTLQYLFMLLKYSTSNITKAIAPMFLFVAQYTLIGNFGLDSYFTVIFFIILQTIIIIGLYLLLDKIIKSILGLNILIKVLKRQEVINDK